MPRIRLDKFFSSQNLATRKEVKELLKQGAILVNGQTGNKAEDKIDPEKDEICLNGTPVNYKKYLYLMMNKPQGVVSATNDRSQTTVLDLVPPELFRPGLFPAGRLDKDTTGFLLLTDDGEFDAASKRAFIMECEEGYESHFDFVLYERSTRRIVLCIEVDGGQHRYVSPADASDCEGKLAYRRQAYRKKDAIALDMGAMLLHGNDSLGVMRAASGGPYTFTMLRLATNGTSACETERLAGTGGSASRGFATIERLIDGQLECGAGSWPTINPAFDLDECAMPDCADIKAQVGKAVAEDDEARPISKILRGWRESGSMPRALRAQDVNRALQDAGLIERREEGWFSTPLGRRLGIREKTVEDRKDGASYCIYPASCEDELLTVVREGLEA